MHLRNYAITCNAFTQLHIYAITQHLRNYALRIYAITQLRVMHLRNYALRSIYVITHYAITRNA